MHIFKQNIWWYEKKVVILQRFSVKIINDFSEYDNFPHKNKLRTNMTDNNRQFLNITIN